MKDNKSTLPNVKNNLDFTEESLLQQMKMASQELSALKLKNETQLRRINSLLSTNHPNDIISFEKSRESCIKGLENYMKLRIELIKLQYQVISDKAASSHKSKEKEKELSPDQIYATNKRELQNILRKIDK